MPVKTQGPSVQRRKEKVELEDEAAKALKPRLFQKRFQAKWRPVRMKKTRRNKELEPGSASIRTETALDEDNLPNC